MDKNAIKKYAIWARRELIARVSQKALQYGITNTEIIPETATSVNGIVLSAEEIRQRKDLIKEIKSKGYEQVMEEVAYTWFNRFVALRYMEVNVYLPSHVRVFTDDANAFNPQIMTEAINLEINGINKDKVYALKNANNDDGLFKYLITLQCNALNPILPGMFQKISNYTELLFPDNLLRDGSVIHQMIELIPEEDWKDEVQIIGWLYQYYNSEKKDEVFAALKKNVKITKENIPAATQLFTPDWIVRYMVENSLGRLWIEGHPSDKLKSQWKYYLDEAQQEPEVQEKLAEIRKEYAKVAPEQMKCIDPCCGSGHILVYMFDILIKIYEEYGYSVRDAVRSIIENNIYGLDIDERAAQLAYFAVMMKARQYDKRFLNRKDEDGNHDVPQPQVYSPHGYDDGMEYGSLIKVDELEDKPAEVLDNGWNTVNINYDEELNTWNFRRLLYQKYDVVVTNPPYMGSSGMGAKLGDYVKKNYPDSKSDLFAVFIERCGEMLSANGYQAMITQHSWMFLSSFEKLRVNLMHRSIINMAHLGARAFEEIGGEVVQTTAFVMTSANVKGYLGTYARLVDYNSQQAKEDAFLAGWDSYIAKQENFEKIPGMPVAYWVSEIGTDNFERGKMLANISNPRQGLISGDVNRFVRIWWECDYYKIGFNSDNQKVKWFPYNNGGEFRKWYGNNFDVVNWHNDGIEIRNFVDNEGRQRSRPQNQQYYFLEGGTWSAISSGAFSVRFFPAGFLFSNAGMAIFAEHSKLIYLIAMLNTKICQYYLKIFSETLNYNQGDIARLPIIFTEHRNVFSITNNNITLSRTDWDSFETSWDFKKHPLISSETKISSAFDRWQNEAKTRFDMLKSNEEELNRIFIDIYGLQDELTPEVADKDVTVRLADKKRDIKSLISYAVGCMFGRYSLDEEGLAYAGGEWDESKYVTFKADADNIIPICDDEYFSDDIASRFIRFIEVAYGSETLNENLQFVADALGGSDNPKDVIRKYFISEFYADHLKVYQKRPIYWLFDSGKKNGFKALIYMHRYAPDTIARMRTDYIHEQQSRYRTAISDLEQRITSAATSERVKLTKKLSALQEQAAEIQSYEEKIHHLADQYISIDLDDGVKKNYAFFGDVLAKIK